MRDDSKERSWEEVSAAVLKLAQVGCAKLFGLDFIKIIENVDKDLSSEIYAMAMMGCETEGEVELVSIWSRLVDEGKTK